MNFEHQSANQFFGFSIDHKIPFVVIDNPFVYVSKYKKKLLQNNREAILTEDQLKSLWEDFGKAAAPIEQFFAVLQSFHKVPTTEFETLFTETIKLQDELREAQNKLSDKEKQKRDLEVAQ